MKYYAIIDPRLSLKAIDGLKKLDIEPVPVPLTPLVDTPVAGHPDIQIFLHRGIAFIHPDAGTGFMKRLHSFCEVRTGSSRLSHRHPSDTAYNVAVTGEIALHKKNTTDDIIECYLKDNNIRLVDVKQGYTRCSTLIVDEKSIITADRSIHNAASENGLDALLISPGHINLPGYKYGFIGGTSGRFEQSILLTGTIDHHPDRDRIYSFIESKGLSVTVLSDEPAYDAGSILTGVY